jgi:hypothetical protein
MMGETAEWAPIWTGLYKANALTLDRYHHGRVLLAGDAAHLVPIFGVRGANSGIDDADNLAWKLALVVRGTASPQLLASYSHERVAAAHENLAYGRKSTEFMAPPDFAFELMRTAVLGLAGRHPGLRPLINPRQTSAICYRDSPLNAWPERSAAFAAGPVPGQVLPECPLTLADGSQGHHHRSAERWLHGPVVHRYRPGAGDLCRPGPAIWSHRGARCTVCSLARAAGMDADAVDHTGRLFRSVRCAAGQPAAGAAGRPPAGALAGRAPAGGLGRSRHGDAGLAATRGSRMSDDELDAVYTHLCQALGAQGEAQAPLMLARLALLLIDRLGDAPAAHALIEAAAQDLRPPTAS